MGNSVAIGNYSYAQGGGSLALGSRAFSTNGGLSLGWMARADGDQGTMAFGTLANATGSGSIAIGRTAKASAGGIAIGDGSVADGAGLGSPAYLVGGSAMSQVSFGSAFVTRRLSGVAAGAADTDAANVAQVKAAVATARDYTDAKAAQTLGAAKDYADAGDARTLDSARTYADAGDAATLASARSYTDTTAVQTLNSANAYTDAQVGQLRGYVDDRFHQTDKRIARIGAISSAAMQAAINTAGLSGRNRVGVGVGFQGGERALSIGYQRIVRPNFSVSLGGGFAGNDRQAGVGAGFSW